MRPVRKLRIKMIRAWRKRKMNKLKPRSELKPARGFNVIEWEYGMRYVGSAIAGLMIAVLISLVFRMLVYLIPADDLNNPFEFWTTLLVAGILFSYFIHETEDDKLKVPPTKYGALLLWLGMPLPKFFRLQGAYLKTGNFNWTGKRLGFSFSRRVSGPWTTTPEDSEPAGFLKKGHVQFEVWDNRDAKVGSDERRIITVPCKNDADISGSLTLNTILYNGTMMLNSDRAAVDLGEKARQELRELGGRFVDTDIPKLHAVLKDILVGRTIVTCFIGKAIPGHKDGAMVRDDSGEVMFKLVKKTDSKKKFVKAVSEASKKLTLRIIKEGNEDMMKAAIRKPRNPNEEAEINLKTITIKDPIGNVLNKIGVYLEGVRFSDIKYSDPVTAAANAASAEQGEYASQLASSVTQKEVRRNLLPSKKEAKNPLTELTTIIAAAQDSKNGNIRVNWVPSVAGSIIAAGSEIGGK